MATADEAIKKLRMDYSQSTLDESSVDRDPIRQFKLWFQEALDAQISEPHAMTVATATPDGIPSARILLLRGADESGFSMFTNYGSRKGRELEANPRAALVFLWHELERQVRVEGRVVKVTPEESDEYFHSRPPGSKLGAWASPQSSVISGREELERKHRELEAKYPDGHIPRPPHWGGYRLIPSSIEFWQGRRSRLHDRLRFRREGDGPWILERLSP